MDLTEVAAWVKRNTLGRTGRQVLAGDLVVTGSAYSSQGTFTPAITAATPGTLSVTYTTQAGRYLLWGKWCFFTWFININAFTLGTASGNLRISGLPYTSANNTNDAWLFTVRTAGVDVPSTSTPIDLHGYIGPGWNYAQLYVGYDNGSGTAVQIGGLSAGDNLRGTGFYLTA